MLYLKKYIDKNQCIINPKDFSPFKIGNIITANNDMKKLIDLCIRVAKSEASVLIYGPSGVGKEKFAELIHDNSMRSGKAFVKLNCAAIPENLMESEFFGYEAGAFTGAGRGGKKGLIELAEGGTLFLDEIGEMPFSLQSKMLRVLQDGKFYRIGGRKEITTNVRVISATNKDLKYLIKQGSFREDLYFRLNVIPVHIPPLKDRIDDIPILVLYFLNYYSEQYNMNKQITLRLMKQLLSKKWEGNVRELKNIVERLVLISLNDLIDVEDLEYANFASKRYDSLNSTPKEEMEGKESGTLKELVEKYEVSIIQQAVKKYGSIRKAAKVLDVAPSTLSRKLQQK